MLYTFLNIAHRNLTPAACFLKSFFFITKVIPKCHTLYKTILTPPPPNKTVMLILVIFIALSCSFPRIFIFCSIIWPFYTFSIFLFQGINSISVLWVLAKMSGIISLRQMLFRCLKCICIR